MVGTRAGSGHVHRGDEATRLLNALLPATRPEVEAVLAGVEPPDPFLDPERPFIEDEDLDDTEPAR